MSSINFLIAAYGKAYEEFSLLHLFGCLVLNKNSSAEVLVNDVEKYRKDYKTQLEFLENYGEILVRQTTYHSVLNNVYDYNAVRYLTSPILRKDLTFFSDVDILLLDTDIANQRKKHIEVLNLPYSATIRHKTGRHFRGWGCVKTDEWYTESMYREIEHHILDRPIKKGWHWDELVWCSLAKEVHGLPESFPTVDLIDYTKENFHSPHGIHLSSRANDKLKSYVLEYRDKYLNLKKLTEWNEYLKILPNSCKNQIKRIEQHI